MDVLSKRFGQTLTVKILKVSWRLKTQDSDYSQQYCIINIKVSKKLDLHCSHHKKKKERKKKWWFWNTLEVLANMIVMIIL